MESVEEDFSFKLNTFIWNVNNKRLEALLYLEVYAIMLYFTKVQPCIGAIISHQALQK